MRILKHDIWDIHDQGYSICLCTNGFVKKSGEAVMGRGLAYEATQRYPKIQKKLGDKLKETRKNIPFLFKEYRIITFPTKHNWWEKSDLELIRKSCYHLKGLLEFLIPDVFKPRKEVVFLPIPGIGNGQLDKEMVMPILEEELGSCNRVVIVEKPF